MINFLSQLDTEIFLAVNGFHNEAFDQFMWIISSKLVWLPLYAVILIILMHRYGWRAGLMITAGAVVAVTIADQTCATIIRPLVERMRPSNLDNPLSPLVHIVNGYHGGRYGFPSCHAANTFAFATFMSLLFKKRKMVLMTLFGWALINCWSRMYLGVHYPGDLLVGGLIGALSGLLAYRGFMWLIQRIVRYRVRRESVKFHVNIASIPDVQIDCSVILAAVGIATSAIAMMVSLINYVF